MMDSQRGKTPDKEHENSDKHQHVIKFGELPFVKLLVTADKIERDRASKKFERWIRTQNQMTLLDARKLWKALFYGNCL
jgi:Nucleolar protein,Nop52